MKLLAIAGGVFVLALALTFPTDSLVRFALDRVAPGSLVFARARLRPWGFRLDGVGFRRPDGATFVGADWLTLRPSLAGLLRDWTGRPWHAEAASCSGELDGVLDRDGTGNVLGLTWKDVDLGHCPPLAVPGETLTGVTAGSARIRSAASGDGQLALRTLSWSGARRIVAGAPLLHADTAEATWRLEGRQLTLGSLALHGPELDVTGSGTVRFADTLGHSAVDLVLSIAAGRGAPPDIRDLIGRLPAGPRVLVTGTVEMPLVVSAP
jgi:type II secretion system protein N